TYQPPTTPTEQHLTTIWTDLLDLDHIGIGDDFFNLGGHSLLATRAISRIRTDLDVDLPLAALFDHPTIAALAARIDAGTPGTDIPPIRPADRGRPLPLSFAQQRLWFLHQLDPAATDYHVPLRITFDGPADAAALGAALTALVERHEILRTRLVTGPDGVPYQVIDPPAAVPLAATDDPRAPFDLARGPLLRAALAESTEDHHTLALTMHHVIADEWSGRILRRELSAALAGAALPPLQLQYADFAVWQRTWFTGPVRDAQLAYWRAQLADPPALELPTVHPRPAVRSTAGAVLDFAIPAHVTAGLRRMGTTAFMALTAAYAVLLHRYTGQDDLLIGTPVANRNHPDTEALIGFFVNTLVLRIRLAGDPTFAEVLADTRATALEAFANQDLPFEQLVDELVADRDRSYTPLVQTLFTYAAEDDTQGIIHDGTHRHDDTDVKFDLSLVVEEAGDRLVGGVHYSTALFDRGWAERFVGHLLTLLEAVVADPGRRLSQAPILTADERDRLRAADARAVTPVADERVAALVARQAADRPDAIAVVHDRRVLTYRELDDAANRLAHHLLDSGVEAETVVGVCLDRGIDAVVAMLAVWKAGGAYLPLDPALPAERIEFMRTDSAAKFLLDRNTLDDPAVRAALQGQPSSVPRVRVLADQLAYVIYTSGSTGRPKAVQATHRGLANLVAGHRATFGIDHDTVRLQFASSGFDVAVGEVAAALAAGATLVVPTQLERTDPGRLTELIRDRRVTVASLPPAVLGALAPGDLPGLATLVTGGEQLDAGLAALWATHSRLVNSYGPTETTICATTATLPAHLTGPPPIGRPIANIQVHLLDRYFEPVPAGVVGEIFIGGTGVTRGYRNRPALTAASFVPDPFTTTGGRLYRTGDLARRLADGQLEFLGRTDHQIKIRGHRVEPAEIQHALTAHPHITAAVVTAVEARLVAYVVPANGDLPPADELRAHLGRTLPDHMIPALFIELAQLPVTVNGKLDRAALPVPDATRPELSGGYRPPATATEDVLAGIWAELLGLDRVGTADNFFDLGGNSLLAVQVVARVRAALDADIALAELFDRPTVAALAASMHTTSEPGDGPIARADRGEPIPLSFGQQRLWFLAQLDPESVEYNIPIAIPLDDSVDPDRLADALTALVERHEVLRTRLVTGADGTPYQVVDPPARVPLKVSPMPEEGGPFDLAAGPLLRATLVRPAGGGSRLVLTMHHVISDAWSAGILRRELTALLTDASLPPLPIQYADYAVWQRQWLAGPVLDAQLAYWRAQLADPPVLELPTDRPRPAVRSAAGGLVEFTIPADVTARLRELSRQHGTTMFMTLTAAYAVFLARHTGQDDILIGTPVAGRGRAETEGLIGFFINTLVLRTQLDDDPTFAELLARTRTTALNGYAHQDLPFEQLVDELVHHRDRSRTPLIDTVFTYMTTGDPSGVLPAKWDLTLTVLDAGGETLTAALQYSTALFDEATVADWAAHFAVLLAGAAADVDMPVSQLPVLNAAQQAWLAECNDTDAPTRAVSIVEVFEAQAATRPDEVAVVDGQQSLTYAQLNASANRVARSLIGADPGTVVAVRIPRSADLVIAMLGVLKTGAAYLPIDVHHPDGRIDALLHDAAPHVVL
ncbi:amino acid adenylation domain-containing protein, partial [Dactylosporangium darangshiense]|uniref:amino acid adenylation domain-containing protein n=1 Tax=Dactylosporangium darangshiense TaxID=579108 RepID=UPI0031EE0096